MPNLNFVYLEKLLVRGVFLNETKNVRQPQVQHQQQISNGIDYSLLKLIIKDTITEVLTV